MFKSLPVIKAILLLSALNCFSDINKKEHTQTIFLELGGGGIFYSINYEYLFFGIKNKARIGARFGYCILPSKGNLKYENHFMFFIPFILGSNKSKLELNFGYIHCHLTYNESTDYFPVFSPGIGYRYQKKYGKYNFRIGFSPMFLPGERSMNKDDSIYFLPTGFLSFGYSF